MNAKLHQAWPESNWSSGCLTLRRSHASAHAIARRLGPHYLVPFRTLTPEQVDDAGIRTVDKSYEPRHVLDRDGARHTSDGGSVSFYLDADRNLLECHMWHAWNEQSRRQECVDAWFIALPAAEITDEVEPAIEAGKATITLRGRYVMAKEAKKTVRKIAAKKAAKKKKASPAPTSPARAAQIASGKAAAKKYPPKATEDAQVEAGTALLDTLLSEPAPKRRRGGMTAQEKAERNLARAQAKSAAKESIAKAAASNGKKVFGKYPPTAVLRWMRASKEFTYAQAAVAMAAIGHPQNMNTLRGQMRPGSLAPPAELSKDEQKQLLAARG